MTFAGFWVDGAVRKPEARHCDMDDTVITKWKREDDAPTEFDICRLSFSCWDKVYWLDTTPRESLTPEELFSIAKVLWPDLYMIRKDGESWLLYPENDQPTKDTPIAWGDLTQYPPPAEPQWIRIARENVAQYLFRECRFKDCDGDVWFQGKIAGWCETERRCLVHSSYSDDMPVMVWNIVEVQNAPTP